LRPCGGLRLGLPQISVPAFPSTYLTTDILRRDVDCCRLNHFEQNCTGCHGVSGHGDGPAASSLPIKPADLSARTRLCTLQATSIGGYPMAFWRRECRLLVRCSPKIIAGTSLIFSRFCCRLPARVIEPKIQPGQYWLGPPDFQVTDEDGKTHLLSDYQRKSALLVALFSCTQENIAQETRGLSNCLLPVSGWPRLARKSSWWRRAKFVSPSAPLQLARS